ncbi:hypothetical protein L798_13128 [Zootermopsis nevadensis]|uniref:C2H2-type domain-containing protein n=1 Tax=Zootermopsis nevadensis TaxID=136037 RepID=A0A067QSS0_ZOONE|nr:hypothetical protein L798_13128 [Zootermopsis nevadensis]
MPLTLSILLELSKLQMLKWTKPERLCNKYDPHLYRPCNYCGKVMRRSSLRKHTIDRHMPSQAPIQCLYCPKVFRTANSLQNHHSIYHRNLGKKARQAASEPSV